MVTCKRCQKGIHQPRMTVTIDGRTTHYFCDACWEFFRQDFLAKLAQKDKRAVDILSLVKKAYRRTHFDD